ncbi:hypothetical protein F511_27796 [Dorcoceras hygrometricum]|uniref:Spindle pole body component 110-like n=1 Tax=Dorcoceras hygrometricum TaxID=472368 RepID=A0A2Z7CJC2_9LAMI|nr:hypothetical protein F511_27796 [Dorcoceras hygrometricum]
MANQSTEEEVLDFSNTEFTREDLINALNEIVHEYRKLSQTFEEVKAENVDLKNSSVEPRSVQLGKADSLQIELSKLKAENDSLRLRSSELEAENENLNEVMSSWTKSSISLSKLHEAQNPLNDKSGLGFNVGESITGETSTQSHLVYDKFKKMSFVKDSVIYDNCELVRYDDQNSSKLNQKGKAGIGYLRPENSKPSWLKNRLDKDKAKAGSKSFVSHQPRRSSKKVKSVWRKVQPRRDLYGQNIKPTLNRYHNISAQTLMDYHTGKNVKISPIRSTTRTETPSSACTRSTDEFCTNGFSSSSWPETNFRRRRAAAAACGREEGRRNLGFWELIVLSVSTCVTLNGSGIQLAVGPQPLWLRNHNSGLAQRIMVKRLATSPHDPLGITDSACKNQSRRLVTPSESANGSK